MTDNWKDQPREPKGVPEGGQWTDEGVTSAEKAAREAAGVGYSNFKNKVTEILKRDIPDYKLKNAYDVAEHMKKWFPNDTWDEYIRRVAETYEWNKSNVKLDIEFIRENIGNYIRLEGQGLMSGLSGETTKRSLYEIIGVDKDGGLILRGYRHRKHEVLPAYNQEQGYALIDKEDYKDLP
mgnify:CR=1 FL=1